ncbi:MAG: ABC transporter substrate-binding protein [Bacteroidia bacterium]|nr:ABC transporter substrate-binding protein [Bacteroidia bacterium]
MKKLCTLCALFLVVFFAGCADKEQKQPVPASQAKGGVKFGGILRVNEIDRFKSLMPMAISEQNAYHIASQVYEGLVKYNQFDLSLVPGLAKTWEISKDLREYTFHLRTNAKFHNDSCFKEGIGRYATAGDVLFSFESLCSKNINNSQFDITFKDRVEGANENYEQSGSGKVHSISGVTVMDDSTLKIKLLNPDPTFLNILAMPGCFVFPKEAGLKYGNRMRTKCVGTGPFFVDFISEGKIVELKRNAEYWGKDVHGNQLPYLDGIHWTFVPDKTKEVEQFRDGKLDAIYNIPVDLFHQTLGQLQDKTQSPLNFDIYSSPALSTHFYGMNVQMNPFFSVREIRRAMNLAIDRKKIAEITLKGEGTAAVYGIVPYTKTFEKAGYNYKALRGFNYNPDSARKLLKMSGYPMGQGLPAFNLEINSGGGERNLMVALAVQKMLKDNLGINVNLNVVSWSEHMSNVHSGKSDFFRYAWVSDYPDPESFLTLFYGQHVPDRMEEKSYINVGRFKNVNFDALFLASRLELDKAKRFKLMQQAEQILMDEAAFMPLYYDENMRLVQKNVKNFRENPMGYMDMTYVYFS